MARKKRDVKTPDEIDGFDPKWMFEYAQLLHVARRTVHKARQQLIERARGGTHCPVCEQHVQIYRVRFRATAAYIALLIARWIEKGAPGAKRSYYRDGKIHINRFLTELARGKSRVKTEIAAAMRGGASVVSPLVDWALLEPIPGRREDGGQVGWYTPLPLLFRFVHGRARIPSHAYVYNAHVLHFSAETIKISEAFGKRFNWQELMEA